MGTKWSHCQEKVYAKIIQPKIIKQLSYVIGGKGFNFLIFRFIKIGYKCPVLS